MVCCTVFQIWLNLPAAYQEVISADVAQQALPDGGVVRVITGLVAINQQMINQPSINQKSRLSRSFLMCN
jgi:redox-sensitive bicupin YhaK (pirin superfamily)